MSARTLPRYLGASLIALGVDLGCYLLLLHFGLMPTLASALAYALGIAAHWLLSSRAVFTAQLSDNRRGRLRQQALFIASALLGLAVTSGVVGALTMLGIDPRLAKLAAIGASFILTWLVRDRLVFA
ncbi:GtrA family protein [Novosphingobium rosa]|uniref:GtrA family protein n=1 Tax=Novosphingobium rosa TaxID=76978 RepID=UPI0008332945|nr:GtrA family protein [Novosphingobium rosa]